MDRTQRTVAALVVPRRMRFALRLLVSSLCVGFCVVATASDGSTRLAATAPVDKAFSKQAGELIRQALAHEHGEGVPRDPEQAARLYCEAARLGHPEAMFSLGWMYANGRGVERDDALAGGLFGLAAKRGHEHAQRMLRFTGDGEASMPACLADSTWNLDERIGRMSLERQRIARLIVELAPEYQISPSFALAIAITESALNPQAVSPKNAMGVMQLIPDTAARFRVSDIFDPEQNIRGGLAYLRWLLAYFQGDIALAAAAYNAGEGAVERYRGVPPFAETRAYVDRIMRIVQRADHPYDERVVQPSTMLAELRATRLAEAGS